MRRRKSRLRRDLRERGLEDYFFAFCDAEAFGGGGLLSAEVVGFAVFRLLSFDFANAGSSFDVVVHVADEVDVVDGAAACGGGESENGLSHADAGALTAEIIVEAAGGHVEGDDLLLFVIDGNGL